jgi:hypothetical protein
MPVTYTHIRLYYLKFANAPELLGVGMGVILSKIANTSSLYVSTAQLLL